MSYYIAVLLIYFFVDLLAIWGFNLELGVAGIGNFAFIVLVATGAYTYAMLTLGPSTRNGAFQNYFIGASWPPALALLAAVLVSAAMGAVISLTGLRRVRADYQAIVMLMIAIMLTTIASGEPRLLNGVNGLSLIKNPIGTTSAWAYVAFTGACATVGYLVLRRFTGGPLGRSLRAMRDDDVAASGIGKNVVGLRIMAQVVGGGFGGLSGALLAGFIGGWSPSAWAYGETLVLATAIVVGGSANDFGVAVGAALVPVLILQGSEFLPVIGNHPQLTSDIGWIFVGVVTLLFMYFRPQGLVPERSRTYSSPRLARQLEVGRS